jgi:hypothetical protein
MSDDPLDVVAGKIVAYIKKSDDQVISAAMLLLDAKKRVENGEGGGDWIKWRGKHLSKLSPQWVNRLLEIARSPDPHEKLAEMRDKNAQANRNHRQQKSRDFVTVAMKLVHKMSAQELASFQAALRAYLNDGLKEAA